MNPERLAEIRATLCDAGCPDCPVIEELCDEVDMLTERVDLWHAAYLRCHKAGVEARTEVDRLTAELDDVQGSVA